ncbi:Sigma-70 region 2 [Aeromicrobium marinum DSM 15272]|uniref:Sigma-70 region 2 n=1 Tax=Aeromicrobium marinum DSM 15272 TaxID=585531 RepID=E2SE79_9ACTN|nr:sigma-70 family RNA polymerase sigma factor [Aeromicrobium marinum]EFQ82806.1 Sigma-70 region 2 [Aeromicrobium marinum DSM 15272]
MNAPTDAELVAGVLAGDREAFAAVYDRYGGKLYDFAYAMMRSREEAEDSVADSFVILAERLTQLRDPDRLRPWLYAVVRSECLRRLKARKRVVYDGEDQLVAMADDARTPEDEAQATALRELVWDAAAGLADRDRALLDLHLRQGLEGAELGEAMGVTAANAYVMLSRLRTQVDRSLGALLIARLGRDDCDELDDLLADWDGSFSPLIRKRVARHVDGCDVCSERRKVIVSPWALLAAVPVFTVPLGLRDRVMAETTLVAMGAPGSGGAAGAPATGLLRSTAFRVAAAVLAVVAVVATVLLWPGGADDDVPAPSPATATTEPAEATPSPTDPATTEPPAEVVVTAGTLTLSTRTIDLGATAGSAPLRLTNTGGEAVSYRITSGAAWLTVSPPAGTLDPGRRADVEVRAGRGGLAEGPTSGTLTVTWDGGSATVTVRVGVERPPTVGAPGITDPNASCADVPVSVGVSDESGLTSVVLSWSGPGGSGSSAMSASGGSYSTTMGPFASGGPVTMQVTATDTRGNVATGPATTSNVNPCPG